MLNIAEPAGWGKFPTQLTVALAARNPQRFVVENVKSRIDVILISLNLVILIISVAPMLKRSPSTASAQTGRGLWKAARDSPKNKGRELGRIPKLLNAVRPSIRTGL
jgi:hypothetical protein